MFVFARNMQRALADKARRAGLAGVAGVLVAVGAGFLVAALWSWLAHDLGWGASRASLTVGVVLMVIAGICLALARRERHPVPSVDELRAEIEQQVNLAANAAVARATELAGNAMDTATRKAGELMERAEQKAHSVADNLSYRADLVADRAEARLVGAARRVGERAAEGLGGGRSGAGGAGAGLRSVLGAVALGLTIANRLRARRGAPERAGRRPAEDWPAEDSPDEDWPDEGPKRGSRWDPDGEDTLRELD